MSDVGAIVLTVGERTTDRALESLAAQTLAVAEVVVVDGVRPFHRAFNSGAGRMSMPYFVQVDADMILDPDCIEVLRGGMLPGVGIAVGALRDPLMGRIAGVKLFRRSCLDASRLRDTIGPEVDLYLMLERQGWLTRYLTGRGDRATQGITLGAHRPGYGVDYVFGTYYLLGRLCAHREDAVGMRWRLTQLRRSAHPGAPVARLAMALGLLGTETRDIAKPRPSPTASIFLHRLMAAARDGTVAVGRIRQLMALAIERLFEAFYEVGATLRSASPSSLGAWLNVLGGIDNPRSLLAELALGGGALATSPSPAPREMPDAFARLAQAWRALQRQGHLS